MLFLSSATIEAFPLVDPTHTSSDWDELQSLQACCGMIARRPLAETGDGETCATIAPVRGAAANLSTGKAFLPKASLSPSPRLPGR